MIIQNFQDLVANRKTESESYARGVMLDLLDLGVNSVLPQNLIGKSVKLIDESLSLQNFMVNLSQIENIYVVGAGKASGAMAEALEQVLGSRVTAGFVNILEGTKDRYATQIIHLNEANHPIPSKSGVSGAKKIAELVQQAKENDLIIILLSGGGSALLPLPVNSIDLQEKQALTQSLLKSGATIQEINTVRKHCSQIKGGQLAKLGYPALIFTLILSDVIKDPLESIASGPTVPDPSTFNQAIKILKKYRLWETTPPSIQQYFQNGVKGKVPETPKPSDKIFRKTHAIILGSIKEACEAIKEYAHQKGFTSEIYSSEITGDTHVAGKKFLKYATNIYTKSYHTKFNPIILIGGGETTVRVTGKGQGGRCQEMGLTLISEFEKLDGMVFVALGTDGIDGFSDAAGVIIDRASSDLAKERQLNVEEFLKNNDSFHFFKELGDSLIFTGPTGTNVNDLMLFGIF